MMLTKQTVPIITLIDVLEDNPEVLFGATDIITIGIIHVSVRKSKAVGAVGNIISPGITTPPEKLRKLEKHKQK